ncbi:MAG: DUF72 domain-containing protein [bacterium]
MDSDVRIGLAGRSEAVSKHRTLYPVPPDAGSLSGLQRYACTFDFAEVNASFYRRMRRETFQRWADDTPEGFGFSVKVNRGLTHFHRLRDTSGLADFLESVGGLGDKLLALLVQLPPTLALEPATAGAFFAELRSLYPGAIACEPRHDSWLSPEARGLLEDTGVGIVRTAIPPAEEAAGPGPVYVRLHGTPRRYYSSYSSEDLRRLADWLDRTRTGTRIVVFDNTATSAATRNALELRGLLSAEPSGSPAPK